MTKLRKLFWHANNPTGDRLLWDDRKRCFVGGVEYSFDTYKWRVRIGVSKDASVGREKYCTMEEAKRAVEVKVAAKKEVVFVEENQILVKIYEAAFRNVIAAPDIEAAKKIARDVMADPAKWLKENNE